jgi:hypothetical protein
MAAENQGQRRRGEGRNNGGAAQPQREPRHDQGFVQGVQQRMEQVSDRLSEGSEAAWDDAAHRYRQAEGIVARHPSSSVLIGFGLGFGLGLALASTLFHREETWAERYLPDSLRELPDRVGKMRLKESVHDASDSLHDAFQQLSSTIRDLPSAIARMMPGR